MNVRDMKFKKISLCMIVLVVSQICLPDVKAGACPAHGDHILASIIWVQVMSLVENINNMSYNPNYCYYNQIGSLAVNGYSNSQTYTPAYAMYPADLY